MFQTQDGITGEEHGWLGCRIGAGKASLHSNSSMVEDIEATLDLLHQQDPVSWDTRQYRDLSNPTLADVAVSIRGANPVVDGHIAAAAVGLESRRPGVPSTMGHGNFSIRGVEEENDG